MSTFSPTKPRLAPPELLPTPLARLDEYRDEVAKAWLVRAVERASLTEIGALPLSLAATELPALVSDLVRATAGGTATGVTERADWLDRLDELRGSGPSANVPLAGDIGVLQSAMLSVLESQAMEFSGADLIAAASRLAQLFSELQADAAERAARAGSGSGVGELFAGADRLTGLRSQGFGQEHLRHLVSMHKRYGQPFSLLLVDIEGLKRINDAHGTTAGDETLVGVAGAVESAVRHVDTAVRMSDDEFCILLPNQTASRAHVAADRLATAVEQVRDPAGVPLRISIGVVSCPQHASTAEELLELADGALFSAKASGDRVAVGGFEPAVSPPTA